MRFDKSADEACCGNPRPVGGRFGTPIYVNHPYIFTSKLPADATCWPRVTGLPVGKDWTFSAEDNPVGSYRRDLTVPAEWIGDDLILQFDGIQTNRPVHYPYHINEYAHNRLRPKNRVAGAHQYRPNPKWGLDNCPCLAGVVVAHEM